MEPRSSERNGIQVICAPRSCCGRSVVLQRGYVAAAIDYRSAITSGFEAGLADIHRAFDWLRAHAAELHADPQRAALTGLSSGGQLALLLLLNEARATAAIGISGETRQYGSYFPAT